MVVFMIVRNSLNIIYDEFVVYMVYIVILIWLFIYFYYFVMVMFWSIFAYIDVRLRIVVIDLNIRYVE
jgi:hypothetical protein